jgi:hypothetical protein
MPSFLTPSVRLGDFHPLYRLRLVGSAQQLFPNGWPLRLQVGRQSVDRHAVHPRTSLVGPDSFPCFLEVLTFDDFLHQPFDFSRAFCRALRHKRFGPFFVGPGGFTPPLLREGQLHLVFLPPVAHESRCLLTLPFIQFCII